MISEFNNLFVGCRISHSLAKVPILLLCQSSVYLIFGSIWYIEKLGMLEDKNKIPVPDSDPNRPLHACTCKKDGKSINIL